jgi:membrane-bound serine protease (ClpP class)
MEKKVLNDIVAYARSLAQKRGRNVQWAERAVRDALSASYQEALRLKVIDFVAEDMNELLRKLDRRRVVMDNGAMELATEGLAPVYYEMTWLQSVMNAMVVPQVLLFLLVLAIAGIGIEIKNPGIIVPGVVGALSLILFLLIVRIIPINIAGIAFIVLALVLFLLELKITSYGLLTIGGIASFVFGALILFPADLGGWGIPLSSIIATLLVLLAFVFLVLRAVMAAHRAPVATGIEGLTGERGEALRSFAGRGKVLVHGEIWDAEADETIGEKERVVVTGSRGMVLYVKREKEKS